MFLRGTVNIFDFNFENGECEYRNCWDNHFITSFSLVQGGLVKTIGFQKDDVIDGRYLVIKKLDGKHRVFRPAFILGTYWTVPWACAT
ncbi:hypothetical protein C1I60_06095 [Paenibacillus terrae]|uniref:Uncharacterized protein n=1 Tax=Paenibacillus terrae TaxID=159743 RepID=A0A4U2Q3Y2_9BACL|nr:hypothetical protein C1I60_06095 [Paenibacillus terrae]